MESSNIIPQLSFQGECFAGPSSVKERNASKGVFARSKGSFDMISWK